MGRKKLNVEDKKVKFTISINRNLYKKISLITKNKSKYIESILFKTFNNEN